MRTKRINILMIGLAFLPLGLKAQSDSSSIAEEYRKFKEQAMQEYLDFTADAQNEFEEFLSKAWSEYQSFAGGKGAYTSKKPESLPIVPVSSGIIDVQAPPFISVTPNMDQEQEKDDMHEKDFNTSDTVCIHFYGRPMRFIVPDNLRITSRGTREFQVAKYHSTMRHNDKEHLLQKQLNNAVSQMGLNEWGYLMLIRAIADKTFSEMNDRVLFSFYILHSQGFKVRVGRGKNSKQLQLLLAIDNSKEVYSLAFIRINNTKFYIVYGNGERDESIYSYDENADDSRLKEIGLDFTKPLSIASCDMKRKLHLGKANVDIELPYSTAHLRYYDDIPTTVFPIYFKTPLSKKAEKVLSETFNDLGKLYNKVQLVDIMLNFVQTAFEYKIDEAVYGREKYFFPEEVIGLPYSDCEDRAALFAWMVKHYIGYDVVGVLYHDHLATAVCFGNDANLEGKTIDYGGQRYLLCDPTYQNAPMGTIMPKFADAKYEIVKIN